MTDAITDAIRIDCLYFSNKLGWVPLPEIQKHLASCAECSDILTEGFNLYLEYPQCEWLNIKLPPGISSREQFLETAHHFLTEQNIEFTATWENVRKIWPAETMLSAMHLWFRRLHRVLCALTTRMPSSIREAEVGLITKSYKQLECLLGRPAFIELMGFDYCLKQTKREDQEVVDLATELWRRALLLDVKPRQSN